MTTLGTIFTIFFVVGMLLLVFAAGMYFQSKAGDGQNRSEKTST